MPPSPTAPGAAESEPVRRPDHVFIVGLPRTGTNLTRNILNRSPEVGIAGEAHFFSVPRRLGLGVRKGFGERLMATGDLHDDAGARRVVAAVFASTGRRFWGRLAAAADRAAFESGLLASDRTPRALLDLALAHYAGGKPVRGDKTPANIYLVPTLLDWFPGAMVIHTMRDPRAVYASNKRKYEQRPLPLRSRLLRRTGLLFELYASLDTIVAWRHVVALDRRYRRAYPGRYTTLRFEDLVRDPAREVERLCAFLGIEGRDEMLEQAVTNSSYLARGATRGFDAAAVDRWRAYLHPLIRRWFEAWCGRALRDFGYPP